MKDYSNNDGKQLGLSAHGISTSFTGEPDAANSACWVDQSMVEPPAEKRWDDGLWKAPKCIAEAPGKLFYDPDLYMPNFRYIAEPCRGDTTKSAALPLLIVGYELGIMKDPAAFKALAACLVWTKYYPYPLKDEERVTKEIDRYADALRKKKSQIVMRPGSGNTSFKNIVDSRIRSICIEIWKRCLEVQNRENSPLN